jgi:hypothetical protein
MGSNNNNALLSIGTKARKQNGRGFSALKNNFHPSHFLSK